MIIGGRVRALREVKHLSQGDIERRSGLLRAYVSRVENGHTVPAVETLEKFARALQVPLYHLVYNGDEPPKVASPSKRKSDDEMMWGHSGKDARMLAKFRQLLSRTDARDQMLLLSMASKLARSKGA